MLFRLNSPLFPLLLTVSRHFISTLGPEALRVCSSESFLLWLLFLNPDSFHFFLYFPFFHNIITDCLGISYYAQLSHPLPGFSGLSTHDFPIQNRSQLTNKQKAIHVQLFNEACIVLLPLASTFKKIESFPPIYFIFIHHTGIENCRRSHNMFFYLNYFTYKYSQKWIIDLTKPQLLFLNLKVCWGCSTWDPWVFVIF